MNGVAGERGGREGKRRSAGKGWGEERGDEGRGRVKRGTG